MQTNKTHLPSFLILLTLGLSAALLLLFAVVMGGMSAFDLFSGRTNNPAAEMINALAFGVEGIIVLICGWYVLQKTIKRERSNLPIQFQFSGIYALAAFGVIIPALVIGGLVAYQETPFLSWVVLPLLTVFIIILPVWLLLGLGGRGIDLGPRWRFFGIFGLGLTISPFIMVMLELILLLIIIVIAAIFIAISQPALFMELSDMVRLLQNETNQDVVLQLLSPYIVKPGVIPTLLLYLALLVPMIEEFFKPLAVWIFARSIETPAQGFVFGLLSGAAFGMIESLNASADGSSSWPWVVSVRAVTTLLHITASGLVGWGIVSAFREKKILRLVGAYACAVMIHGLWNTCALGAGLSSIGNLVGKPEWMSAVIPAALGGMVVLGVGMFLILMASNRKLQQASSSVEQGRESLAGVQ